MKKTFCMIAALAAFALAPVAANASATVWMNYTGGSASDGDLTVIQNGGPGAQLILEKPQTGTATFTVDVIANVNLAAAFSSTSTNLSTNSSNIAVSESNVNLLGPTNGANLNQITPGFAPGPLLNDFGQGDFFFGITPGDGLLLGTITFVIDKSNGEDGFDIAIDGSIGNTAWAFQGAGIDPVIFGDGPGTNGANLGEFGGTFATIRNIPEPATLSLLGLGAVALIRRRR